MGHKLNQTHSNSSLGFHCLCFCQMVHQASLASRLVCYSFVSSSKTNKLTNSLTNKLPCTKHFATFMTLGTWYTFRHLWLTWYHLGSTMGSPRTTVAHQGKILNMSDSNIKDFHNHILSFISELVCNLSSTQQEFRTP